MSIVVTLQKATNCKPKAKEDRQAYLLRLVKAVSDLPEESWNKLSDESQDWVNDAVAKVKAKEDIPDPDAPEKPAKAEKKPAKAEKKPAKAKAAPVEEDEEDEEDEAEEEAEEDEAEEEAEEDEAEEEAEEDEEEEEAEEDEEEAEEAKAEKKPAKAEKKPAKAASSKSGAADIFRIAFLKAAVKGKSPKPQQLVEQLGIDLSPNYAAGMAYDLRKTVDALRKANLLK